MNVSLAEARAADAAAIANCTPRWRTGSRKNSGLATGRRMSRRKACCLRSALRASSWRVRHEVVGTSPAGHDEAVGDRQVVLHAL